MAREKVCVWVCGWVCTIINPTHYLCHISCLIWLSEKVTQETLDTVSSDTDLVLQQQTPTRVPRRAELTREKIVHTLKLVNADAEATTDPEAIRFLTEKRAEFTAAATTEAFDSVDEAMAKGMLIRADLETSAGTYVKEFVHGDGGRTVPCLQSIFAVGKAQVVSLDVKEIFLNWPNPTQSNLPSY